MPNEAQIHALLAERLQAKKSRDFEKADAMRETLRAAGVEVFDRDKLWRAIPPPEGMGGPPSQPQPPPSKNSQLQYHRAPDDHQPVDVAAVEALLDERLQAKMQRDFVRADQLRDTIRQQHNVEVHDNDRTWHVSRGVGMPPMGRGGGAPAWYNGAGGDSGGARRDRGRGSSRSRSRSPNRR